ncbi:MAG TPA: AMP-binding protein [Acidimicrobiales bacterium]|nr:AMP-binding protein [Acidimicrobiales bacterium]
MTGDLDESGEEGGVGMGAVPPATLSPAVLSPAVLPPARLSPATLSPATHPEALARRAAARPERVAVRFRQGAGWVTWSERQYAAAIARQARHLIDLGLRPGDRVGIVGATSPGWAVGALAAQSAGGTVVSLYPTSAPAQVARAFAAPPTRIVLVGSVPDEDGVAGALDGIGGLGHVLALDPTGAVDPPSGRWPVLGGPDGPAAQADDDEVAFLQSLTARLDPDAPCSVIFTSGTTGDPKAAVHSFRSIAQIVDSVAPALGYREDDDYFVYLPLNHAAEQSNTLVVGGHLGWTLNFGRSMDTIYEDLAAVRPTVVFGVPRIFEKIGRDCLAAADSAATDNADADTVDSTDSTDSVDSADGGGVAATLRASGLDRVRVVLGGGAPMPAEVVDLFDRHGVRIRNGYGSTEGNGICMPWATDPRADTVGTPLPGVDVRLADDGEILVRSHGLCIGYLEPDGSLSPLVDGDGFYHSGDVGELTPDGQLRLVDRKRDIIITSGGKNVSPRQIEQALTASPYLRAAVVVGNGRPYVGALVTPDLAAVRAWADQHGCADQADGRADQADGRADQAGPGGLADLADDDLLAHPAVRGLLDGVVAAVNAGLSRPEQVKRWAVVSDGPAAEAVAAGMKVRRSDLHRIYQDDIDALYQEVDR